MPECQREREVAAVVRAGRWPNACEHELRTHVTACAQCAAGRRRVAGRPGQIQPQRTRGALVEHTDPVLVHLERLGGTGDDSRPSTFVCTSTWIFDRRSYAAAPRRLTGQGLAFRSSRRRVASWAGAVSTVCGSPCSTT